MVPHRIVQPEMRDQVATGGQSKPGEIEVICGCMFSGKSERLVARVSEARAAGLKVAAFKHGSDDRYGQEQIVTHSGRRTAAHPVGQARQILETSDDAALVVIDEAQFFDSSLVDVCRELAGLGRTVVLAGLDRDSWGQPFGPMPQLEAMADRVTRTQGVCASCSQPAEFTQRVAAVSGQRMVGGPEAYEPRCGKCFQAPPMELRR
jgi:thymidine kinase